MVYKLTCGGQQSDHPVLARLLFLLLSFFVKWRQVGLQSTLQNTLKLKRGERAILSVEPVIHREYCCGSDAPCGDNGRAAPRPAAFLDRDGVINLDGEGYNYRVDDLHFVQGAPQAIRLLNERGYYVLVVSNQSGVARGYFAQEDVQKFHREMQLRLQGVGARIDAFAFCPHLAGGSVPGYNIECNCRKPKTGMLEALGRRWPLDLKKSFMVGDKASDMECARSFGVEGHLFSGGDLESFVKGILKEL
jgi:D-glycero-D-manno-heptose 1,7-bisphosphate phosphatase